MIIVIIMTVRSIGSNLVFQKNKLLSSPERHSLKMEQLSSLLRWLYPSFVFQNHLLLLLEGVFQIELDQNAKKVHFVIGHKTTNLAWNLIYRVIWKSISVCQIGKQLNILYFGKIHTEWIYDSVHFCEFRNCSDKSHGRVPFMFIAGIVCKWNPNYFDHLQVLKGISLKSCQNLTVHYGASHWN